MLDILVYSEDSEFCDKCGKHVPPHNDIRELEAIRQDNEVYRWMKARHLLPVVRDGVVVCEGSPSRAQYLEGQPRDTRGYAYVAADEKSYRTAYRRLVQKEAN